MEQPKGIKRKHFELIKSDLAVELTKLTNDSDKLNKDLRGVKADFELMCKSMTERQADFLTHGLFLEEQYGKVIGVLDGKIQPGEWSSAGEDEARRTGSVVDIRKFARDSRESLINHRISREIALQEMETTFRNYEDLWNQNLKEFRERVEKIEKQRWDLSAKLSEFSRNMVEQSSSE